jgi:hypothetical protein
VVAICYYLSGSFFYLGLEYMAAVNAANFRNVASPKLGELLGKDVTKKTAVKKKTAIEVADELLVSDKSKLPANYDNLNKNAQNVAESSVLLPEEFPIELEGEVRRKWRELCSGQVFNGDLLERDFLAYVNRNGPSKIIDIDRYESTTATSAAFLQIVKMRPAGRTMFFKCNFDLKKVNSFDDAFATIKKPARGKSAAINTSVTWSQVKTMTKGKDNVEPDVLIWEWNGRGRPVINIIEMKAGYGEAQASDSNPKEYIQLCRCKRLFEHWLGQLEQVYQVPETTQIQKIKTILGGTWIRPEIRLWFVGFAATTQSQINLGRPGKVWTLANPSNYSVTTLTGAEFGTNFGISVPFINEAVRELNQFRRETLNDTIKQFINPPPVGNAALHRKYIAAIAAKTRNMRAHLRGAGTSRAPVTYLENNENIASFAGLSGFLKGEKGAKLTLKKNTSAKLKKAREERIKTATKPQQVRVRKAVKIANRLLASYKEGGINVYTGNLNNNTENAVAELANGNARLINLAKQRAKEMDPDFIQNNAAVEEFRNALVNNVFRLTNNGAAGLFSQQ